jgi:hypothetical protein
MNGAPLIAVAIVNVATGEASIEHPALVRAGDDVSILVRTSGCGECTQLERTDVRVTGSEAEIRPFDRFRFGVCGDCFEEFTHAVTVRFDDPGPAVIRVFGYMAGDRFGTVIERTSSITVE